MSNIYDYKCIIAKRADELIIKKGIFRMSRGNAWVESCPIDMVKMKAVFGRSS